MVSQLPVDGSDAGSPVPPPSRLKQLVFDSKLIMPLGTSAHNPPEPSGDLVPKALIAVLLLSELSPCTLNVTLATSLGSHRKVARAALVSSSPYLLPLLTDLKAPSSSML